MRTVASILAVPIVALLAAPALGSAPDETAPVAPEQEEPRDHKVSALAQFRTLAIRDEDPRNDQSTLFQLRGQVKPFGDAAVFMRFGLIQYFVAEEGESGYRLQDALTGISYPTPVKLGNFELALKHTLSFYLPTSRASQDQDLYVAPQYALDASMEVLKGLTVSVQPTVQYRWHQYAERAGYGAGMNTQVRYAARGGLDYAVLDSETFGDLGVGASAGSTWDQKYASMDDHESDTSDAAVVFQSYDWEAHVDYTPIDHLSFGVALEHGGRVLRDGIVNTFLVHRDETELAFTLSGAY